MECAGKIAHWDHPRVRGEESCPLGIIYALQGSPPRARGRVAPLGTLTAFFTDHPRVRGEEHPGSRGRCWPQGSPPRARGRGTCSDGYRVNTRITPACAGKSPFYFLLMPPRKDHPRVRGEEGCAFLAVVCTVGSPPRARGREILPTNTDECCRITPACAGKSLGLGQSMGHHRDHPRVRGEETKRIPIISHSV